MNENNAAVGDQLQRVREIFLHQTLARHERFAVVEEDRRDIRMLGEVVVAVFEDIDIALLEDESVARQSDRWRRDARDDGRRRMEAHVVIAFDAFSKRFGATTAVAELTLSVEPREVVALLGPNGSGKTTSIKAAADSLPMGRAWIFGPPVGPPMERDPDRLPPRGLKATIGDWDRQVDLTWIIGLLLRGWRKGLDAETAGHS